MTARLLLVEDDDSIAAPLSRALLREDYDLVRVASGEDALAVHADGGVDLVVLDLGLPDLDGLEVCRRIRERDGSVPVIMLTARGDELDRVVGLDAGADDYLAKPFSLAELLARIRALLRRRVTSTPTQADAPSPSPVAEGDMTLQASARRAFVGGQELQLTVKEFDLLALLHAQAGQVVSRETLMDEVWDVNWYGSTKTLDVTLGRLRKKLADAGASTEIVSVRGVGFRLEPGSNDA